MKSTTTQEGDRRRRAILQYLTVYYREHGFAPSYSEIGKEVGLASKSSVAHHVQALVENGLVKLHGDRGAIPVGILDQQISDV